MPEQPVVTVVCKVCDTRLDEVALDEPHEISCPICFSGVIVPAASQGVRSAPVFKSDPNLEGYAVLPLEGPEAEKRAKKAQDVILVVCPICRARLHSAPRREAYHIRCHDCHELVRVPSRAEHRARQEREAVPEKFDAVEPVSVGAVDVQERTYSGWYLRAQGEIRQESAAGPPRSLYFSGTFTFPWEREIVSKWLFLSLGLSVFAMLAAVLGLMFEDGGKISGLAMGFFALPLIWIGIWTGSYAASVCMAVIVDTANGNQKIVNWADQNWRDWIITMAYVQYLVAVAGLAGYATNRMIEVLGGDATWAGFVITALALPYVVLSSLETGGGLNFISPNVTLTLFTRPVSWVAYYLVAGLSTAGAALAVWGLWRISPLVAGGLGGLLVAAWLLIQARLTGRLAWAISRG